MTSKSALRRLAATASALVAAMAALLAPVAHGQPPTDQSRYLSRVEARYVDTDLVGHSWGGAWSLFFAEQHPDRVERLVLLDSPGLDAEKAPVTPLFTTPALGEVATALTTRSFYADNIRSTFHNKHLVTEEVIDEFYEPFSRPANRAGFLSLWRNLDYRLTDAGLGRVTAPTLVLWGGADTWLPASQADGLAARIPNATATVLPNCGHTVHEDCPAQTIPRWPHSCAES